MSHIKVAASILSADFANLGEEIKALCQAGADYIHVDVMDGHFVPNITIGSCVIKKIKKYSSIPLDVHLMISRPEKYIKDFINVGADFLTIHVEAEGFCPSLIEDIKSYGVKAGIAISPSTKPEVLDDLIKIVDLVLVMTVEPGFGKQEFLVSQLEKIYAIKSKAMQLGLSDLIISVDGGINSETTVKSVNAGANLLVSGSYILANGEYGKKIKLLKDSIREKHLEKF